MNGARMVAPPDRVGALLAGSHFIDAYAVSVPRTGLDAVEVARSLFERQPAWVGGLMSLRHAIVRPLGLKTEAPADDDRQAIGLFPIESATSGRTVLGFADKHLDFRVVVDVADGAGASEVTVTTLVRLNNLLGRAYLTAILPFHMIIVRSLLNRLAAA